MTIIVCNSSLAAFEHNQQRLQDELEKTIQNQQATIQAQNNAQNGLKDRIFLLEKESESKDRRIEELEKKLQSERAASAATTRQVQQLLDKVSVLEKKERILAEATAIMQALEATIPAQAKTWQLKEETALRSSTFRASIQQEMIDASKAYYESNHNGVLAPPYLLPLLKVLGEARRSCP